MRYLLAHCPMLGCNHRNVVCKLPSQAAPQFEPSVYVAIQCANCGQVFRELAIRLVQSDFLAARPGAGKVATE